MSVIVMLTVHSRNNASDPAHLIKILKNYENLSNSNGVVYCQLKRSRNQVGAMCARNFAFVGSTFVEGREYLQLWR